MRHVDTSNLKQLGKTTATRTSSPVPDILETFANPRPERHYTISHVCPEFTSLCPVTGQPDFATLLIEYCAADLCVESKSLKLYLFAYRNEGSFMEEIVNRVLDDLKSRLDPRWLRVTGTFKPRGGIGTTVEAYHGDEWLDEFEPSSTKGRTDGQEHETSSGSDGHQAAGAEGRATAGALDRQEHGERSQQKAAGSAADAR